MKRFRIIAAGLVAVTALGVAASRLAPGDFEQLRLDAGQIAQKMSASVVGNPVPTALGVLTFLATLALRKARAKPTQAVAKSEPLVVRRALARATWTQLLSDQIALENRSKALPGAIKQAERDACYAENALTDAERALEAKEKTNFDAAARLGTLRREKETVETEVAAIKAELQKLAGVI